MRLQYAKRQNTGGTNIPTASGIGGSQTAGDPSPSGTKLVVGTNTGAGSSSTDGTNGGFGSSSLIATSTSTNTGSSQSPTESPAVTGASSGITLSTVIGVCVGAFLGAGLLICFSIWFYRRSSRRPPPRARQKQPLAQSRGVDHTAPWTKFDDDQDQWEGRNEMSEKKGLGDVALTPGFRRTASHHSSGKSLGSDEQSGSRHAVNAHSLPFAHYHPKLAEQMALDPPRPIGTDDQAKASLDGSASGTFLSLGSVHIESGKMSPTFTAAKMTPPATASKLHRWESAEVVDPEAQEVEVHGDPFSEDSTPTTYSPTETFGDRKSFHNPFFNAHPGVHSRRPSTVRKSTMSISSDPFNKDEEVVTMPTPKFVSHTVHDSSSSTGSVGNEKAMKSLIAALDLPQEVIEERLRIASLNPSEISRYSTADSTVGYAMPTPETEEQGYVGR